MKFTKINDGYIIRLERGEEVISSLHNFCAKNSVESAIISGIGAAQHCQLGFYQLEKKEYSWKKFDMTMEIVSLAGNIALVDEKPFAHLHIVVSSSDFLTYGGHLKEAVVGATCEITITPIKSIKRSYNEEIGLKLLDCENSL